MRIAKEISIPKDKAVFWLDKNGFWHNRHGKFEHKRIIDAFHRAIRKDEQGYHLFQDRGDVREKVYFPYEDTALFVFDFRAGKQFTLVLNNRREVPLEPADLYVSQDNLYVRLESEIAKFSERCLLKLAPFLRNDNGRTCLHLDDRLHVIVTDDRPRQKQHL